MSQRQKQKTKTQHNAPQPLRDSPVPTTNEETASQQPHPPKAASSITPTPPFHPTSPSRKSRNTTQEPSTISISTTNL
ncbi:hypothetical protein IQ07DRAFT_591536 [Pyrenochaeta sp. DS3sAY3a]|nr:hypothetical protein IQ07DRAFT_591536 [Pyrenochaeta sp. DS3sAY3a]